MFVEATSNSELKMKMKQSVKKHKMKINIVEKVGETMKTVLNRGVIPLEVKSAEEMTVSFATKGTIATIELQGERMRV